MNKITLIGSARMPDGLKVGDVVEITATAVVQRISAALLDATAVGASERDFLLGQVSFDLVPRAPAKVVATPKT